MTDQPDEEYERPVSRFEDMTPVHVTMTIDAGALQALKDHPMLLAPARPGMYFALAVRRGVEALRAADVTEPPAPPPKPPDSRQAAEARWPGHR